MLTPEDLTGFARLGITREALEQRQVARVTDADARDRLALPKFRGRLDGILFPYLDPLTGRVGTHRLRRDYPEVEAGELKNKYISGYGDKRHLYFGAADRSALEDVTRVVLPVEAEKSEIAVSCAATRLQRPVLAVALGGCWSWRGRIGIATTPNGGRVEEVGPLPDLDRILWAGRDVVIVFDTNAQTNQSVQAARRRLARELAGRGARVRVATLPAEAGINGPDDFIGRHGDEAFFALLEQALDAATADVIFRLNQQHAVVREAGKTIVITETHDPVLERDMLTRSSFTDFRNFYLGEQVPVGTDPKTGAPMLKSLGSVWLAHHDRRQYDGVVMSPECEMPGYLNLWRGFAVTPQPGTWSRFQAHIHDVICAGDDAHYAYVRAWLAKAVQHPGWPAEVALALRGQRGTGKSLFARAFGSLFGQHFLQIAHTKHLVGQFNAHLQDAIVLFADEAFWAGDKAGESVLKMLVTEPLIPIERKGQDVVVAKNMLHLILASNHDWVVPAGLDERRFCVLDVQPVHQQDRPYFAALVQELDAGGRAAMLYDLLRDQSAVDVRVAPETAALREQKIWSLQPNERWLFDKLASGRWLSDHDGWQCLIAKDTLHEDYIQSLQRVGVDRRATETELGMFIAKMLPAEAESTRRLIDGRRRYAWLFPDLAACRAAFDRATHCRHPWNDPDDEA